MAAWTNIPGIGFAFFLLVLHEELHQEALLVVDEDVVHAEAQRIAQSLRREDEGRYADR